jgi:hypothetical protein
MFTKKNFKYPIFCQKIDQYSVACLLQYRIVILLTDLFFADLEKIKNCGSKVLKNFCFRNIFRTKEHFNHISIVANLDISLKEGQWYWSRSLSQKSVVLIDVFFSNDESDIPCEFTDCKVSCQRTKNSDLL